MAKSKGPGRPEAEVDKKLFENLMSIPFARESNVAECLGISVSTLQRWIKSTYDVNFDHLKSKKVDSLKLRLEGKQFELAMKGNTALLIWLGKQHLGQSEKQETKLSGEMKEIKETPQEQLQRIKDMMKEEV